MKVVFELRHNKQDKADTVPVYVSAYFDGLRLRCSTKEWGEPRQWNEREQEFRRSFPGYQAANDELKALKRRLEDRYRELRAANIAPTMALVREAVNPAAVVVKAEPTLAVRFPNFREVLQGRGHAFHTVALARWLRIGSVMAPSTVEGGWSGGGLGGLAVEGGGYLGSVKASEVAEVLDGYEGSD